MCTCTTAVRGCEVHAGAGEETVEEAGPVLHPFDPGFHQRGQLGEVAFGQVDQRAFEVRPGRFDRVEFVRVRRKLVNGQPVPGRDQPGHHGADVGVQVIPDHDDGAAELHPRLPEFRALRAELDPEGMLASDLSPPAESVSRPPG